MAGKHDLEADSSSYPARRFAVDALERGTGVAMDEELKESWAKTGNIEFGEVPFPQVSRSFGPVRDSRGSAIIAADVAATKKFDECMRIITEAGGPQDAAVRNCRDATGIGIQSPPPSR